MTPAEAADCVKEFKPRVVYPYHYRDQDPQAFKTALAGQPIDVRVVTMYPAAAPR